MKENIQSMFNETFKFSINDEVRHKGDTKGYTADMGLLVLKRVLIESQDDDGGFNYERFYHCRMIRFSGSGDMAQFSEKELMSIKEYTEKKVKDEFEMNQHRDESKRVEKEVMELFNITKEDYVHLKDESGNTDTTKKYRMTGFSIDQHGTKLSLTESLMTASKNENVKREQKYVSSKDEFVKVSP